MTDCVGKSCENSSENLYEKVTNGMSSINKALDGGGRYRLF